VGQILLLEVLDPEVVYHEYKLDVSGFVLPKSGHNLALEVPFLVEAFFKQVMAQRSGLGKAIHSSDDHDVDPTIRCGLFT
jgi:hypothetical protein